MSFLLDSNIVIYAAKPAYGRLRDFISASRVAISLISHLEALGYWRLDGDEERVLSAVLAAGSSISVSDEIIDAAILIRRQRRIGLGDSIVAATALHYDLTLATRNVADFDGIPGLRLFNPVD